jgi:hypothetical protein
MVDSYVLRYMEKCTLMKKKIEKKIFGLITILLPGD